MKYFYYGNFKVKILEKITEIVSKGKFTKLEFVLNENNLSEIASNSATPSLFGEKNIFVIDVTDSDPEIIEKFLNALTLDSDVVITYFDELTKTSKILKLFSKEYFIQEFNISKSGNVFSLIDNILLKDTFKTYSELKKLDENEVLIFNNIVSMTRNLISLKFDLNQKSKIIPFKLGLFKKAVERFEKEELVKIFNKLYLNDLKFKKGEITGEMLLLHSVNLFFENKNGNNK